MLLSRFWQCLKPTLKDEGKKALKNSRDYCPKCGGLTVTPMPNGQKMRTGMWIHLENGSERCPSEPRYIELCGFPIGPPHRGSYSKRCMLPAGHAPADACSLYPLPTRTISCVRCRRVFPLVSTRICSPTGKGLVWDTPQMPVHDIPETKYVPPKKRWWQRTRQATLHTNLDRRCPGA